MNTLYRVVAYLGLSSIFGSLIYGFRYAPDAPSLNLLLAVALYLAFAAPHLVMTRAWFKAAVWGNPNGSLRERQVYILVTVATWMGVYVLHRPIGGPAVNVPEWLRFVGLLGVLLAVIAFFEGVTFPMIDGLLGVPGSAMSHSHGGETPLMTTGSYASVRHPMYRAAVLAGLSSLLLHPHLAQLIWAGLIAVTFIGFIPIEESQLIAARGDAYREYQRQTPYRLFRGIW